MKVGSVWGSVLGLASPRLCPLPGSDGNRPRRLAAGRRRAGKGTRSPGGGAAPGDDRPPPARGGADPRASPPWRYALPGQGGQPVRAPHRHHPEGRAGQTYRIRAAREDPEAEAQFITEYAVCERGQAERGLWAPTLDRHIALFNRASQLAVADGGFASRSNER